MIKTKRVENPDKRKIVLTLKVNESEMDTIRRLAKKHAGGNASAWVREAALKFRGK